MPTNLPNIPQTPAAFPPATDSANTPFLPPITPYVMPASPYGALIDNYGVRLIWKKSHLCPCTFAGAIAGSPDPQCSQCSGYGWYWDNPGIMFTGLITFMHLSLSPDEPGAQESEKFGQILRAEPTITIPYNAGQDNLAQGQTFFPTIWQQVSLNDIFVEIDALDRFNAQLQVGGIETVPYQYLTSIAPTGAVTVYVSGNSTVQQVRGYTVSGATVTLPASGNFPNGTNYIVEYQSAKAYVAWRYTGATIHPRPFGQVTLPKRFKLQLLDIWLRNSGQV